MSAFTPSSQILTRHESLFVDKKVIIAGDFHDEYPIVLATKKTAIHCSQFHIYLQLAARKSSANIEFGLIPSDEFYQDADTLIYYWPKNKAEAQFQLAYLLHSLRPHTDIFIVGENRSGVKSAETIFANLTSIQKIDSARRCSLYHCQLDEALVFDLKKWQNEYHLDVDDMQLVVAGLPGIFSQNNLDAGSELLLNALLDNQSMIKKTVLDIGSGCGVLSAFIGKIAPNVHLTLADVSAAAIESSKLTLSKNHLKGDVIASNVFSHITGRFDLIISNPPFHDGKETSYGAAELLIKQAKNHLTHNGALCIVANGFLPYQKLLETEFNRVEVLAQTTKYKVYIAAN